MPVLALLLLTASAWLRGAEYDEQYTLFLTAGIARPVWPAGVFPAATVTGMQQGNATLAGIARDLRTTDVHPPLYFWVMSGWRRLFGPSLFAARMLSVLCGTVSVLLTGLLARARRVPPLPAMLAALGCYGFVYTGGVARGFALAEVLVLAGTLLAWRQRFGWAGTLFGAACTCNYLAIFVPMMICGMAFPRIGWGRLSSLAGFWRQGTRSRSMPRQTQADFLPFLALALSMAPFLALDAWFFVAQQSARLEQFPPFAMIPALLRLATYQTASVFGGLPAYVDGWGRIVLTGLIAGAGLVVLAAAKPWRDTPVLLATLATPAGLILLGVVFNNTPIELRYLSFSLPFAALLLARQGFSRPLCLMMALQAAGLAGLLIAPSTMQPARIAVRVAAVTQRDLVLLPAGNDGVGIVGAFGVEAPPDQHLLLVRPAETPSSVLARIGPAQRVVLALLVQDRDSAAAVHVLQAIFKEPNWRCVAAGINVEVCERTDGRFANVLRGFHTD